MKSKIPGVAPSSRVMVVDDDPFVLELVTFRLQQRFPNMEVRTSTSGTAGNTLMVWLLPILAVVAGIYLIFTRRTAPATESSEVRQ